MSNSSSSELPVLPISLHASEFHRIYEISQNLLRHNNREIHYNDVKTTVVMLTQFEALENLSNMANIICDLFQSNVYQRMKELNS